MYKCDICGDEFKSLKSLGAHSIVHTMDSKECHICGKMIKKCGMYNHIRSHENDKKCLNCDELTTNSKFCSKSCSAIYNNRSKAKTKNKCKYCGKELNSRSQKYCNKDHHRKYEYDNFIKEWKSGKHCYSENSCIPSPIRKYIKNKYRNSCCKCGWNEVNEITGKVPLQIDHIDGKSQNNREDNLRLLCPNCHSLTETYGILNIGNGRTYRYNKLPSEIESMIYGEKEKKYCECGKEIHEKSSRCNQCNKKLNRKVVRPPYEQLLKEIEETNYSFVGRKYGVSDNAIRKWIKYYEKEK